MCNHPVCEFSYNSVFLNITLLFSVVISKMGKKKEESSESESETGSPESSVGSPDEDVPNEPSGSGLSQKNGHNDVSGSDEDEPASKVSDTKFIKKSM